MGIEPSLSHLGRQDQLFRFLFERYGFVVQVSNRSLSTEGELSALRDGILLLRANSHLPDACLFVCAHVFGHVVQLSTTTEYDLLVSTVEGHEPPLRLSAATLRNYWNFEQEAYRIGLGLLTEAIDCGAHLRKRYAAYMRTDMRHYFSYLRTGKPLCSKEFTDLFTVNLEKIYRHPDCQLDPIAIPKGSFVLRKVSIDVV